MKHCWFILSMICCLSFFQFSISAINPEMKEINTSTTGNLVNEQKTFTPSQFLNFPIVNQNEHSMTHALPEYVYQKLAGTVIEDAIAKGLSIEIVGCPPTLLPQTSSDTFTEIKITYEKKINKKENYKRPSYFYRSNGNSRKLVIAVMSGEDYLKQYTAMVSYFIKFGLEKEPDDHVRVIFYPALQDKMAFWTELDGKFVKSDDVVLMGNISNYFDFLKNEGIIGNEVEELENTYYHASRVKLKDRTFLFLRVKYSFWGNMSALLVERMLELGASEIIYLSKIATLKEPDNIYRKIYSPTQLAILEDKQVKIIERLPNYLVYKFPELDSGMHISLATVMEQDFNTSALAHSVATSLDLEVSKIARAILKHNDLHGKQVKFTPIHWSTDYLRTRNESNFNTEFDLATGHSKIALEKKRALTERIYHFLTSYLMDAKLVVDLSGKHN